MTLLEEETRDVELAIGKFQYPSILDISPFAKFHENMKKYFAKVNFAPGMPIIFYIIYTIGTFIQYLGICIFVDSDFLWQDPNSFIIRFLKVLSICWQGYYGKIRLIISFIISIFLYIVIGFHIYCVQKFAKRQTMGTKESLYDMIIIRGFSSSFSIINFASFPTSIKMISKGEINFFTIFNLFSPFITGGYLLYATVFLNCRILFEYSPIEAWTETRPILSLFIISLTNTLSCFSAEFEKPVCYFLMPIVGLIYIFFGIWNHYYFPSIQRNANNWFTTFTLSGGLICLFRYVSVFLKEPISDGTTIVVILAIVILVFVLITIFDRKSSLYYLNTWIQLEEMNDNDAFDYMAEQWNTETKFERSLRICFNYFPSYLFTWKPFRYAVEQFPNNRRIVLIWMKLAAVFENENDLFRWIYSKFSKIHSQTRICYLQQCLFLNDFRTIETNGSILKRIESASKDIIQVRSLEQRLWENILQKTTDSFWVEVHSLFQAIDSLELNFLQLIESYPNNIDVAKRYLKFLVEIKHDQTLAIEWKKKISILQNGGKLRGDLATQCAQESLPDIARICEEVDNSGRKVQTNSLSNVENIPLKSKNNTMSSNFFNHSSGLFSSFNNGESLMNANDEPDPALIQIRLSLEQLVHQSKLGNVYVSCGFILLATIFSLFMLYWYTNSISTKLVPAFMAMEESIQAIESLKLNMARLSISLTVIPSFLSIFHNPPLISSDDETIISLLAPTLYSKGYIGKLQFSEQTLAELANKCKDTLLNASNSISNLDTSNPILLSAYNNYFVDEFKDNLSFQSNAMSFIMKGTNIASNPTIESLTGENFPSLTYDFIEHLNNITSTIVLSSGNNTDIIMEEVNDYMAITIFLIICFVSLTLILTDFSLQMERNAITTGFTTIPATAVRALLPKHSMESRKNNEQLNQVYSNEENKISHLPRIDEYIPPSSSDLTQDQSLTPSQQVQYDQKEDISSNPESNQEIHENQKKRESEHNDLENHQNPDKKNLQQDEKMILNQKESNKETSQAIMLATSVSHTRSQFHELVFLFIFSFTIILICCLVIFYDTLSFITNSKLSIKEIERLHNPITYEIIALSFCFTTLNYKQFGTQYVSTLVSSGMSISDAQALVTQLISLNFQRTLEFIDIGINMSMDAFWGDFSVMNVFVNAHGVIENYSSIFTSDQIMDTPLKSLEEILTSDYGDRVDVILSNVRLKLLQYYLESTPFSSATTAEDCFESAIWCSIGEGKAIDDYFIETVQTCIMQKNYEMVILCSNILIAGIFCQVIISLFSVGYLFTRQGLVKRALTLFTFFDGQVILQSPVIVNLLAKGSTAITSDDKILKNTEDLVANFAEGVLVIDKDLKVSEFNDSFGNMFGCNADTFGKDISEVINFVDSSDHPDSSKMIMHINDVLAGINPPQSSIMIKVSVPVQSFDDSYEEEEFSDISFSEDQNKILFLCVNVIALTLQGPAKEADIHNITSIALIFEDKTNQVTVEEDLKEQQEETMAIIRKVIPEIAINNFLVSDSVSFSIQSASIGSIYVHCDNMEIDPANLSEPFTLYFSIFTAFDRIISKFELLAKVRATGHLYTFVGGLYSQSSKPDKHAEEATRFILNVLSQKDRIRQEIETKRGLMFRAGLNTGGPLVAGIPDIRKPFFELIGNAADLSRQMELLGEFGKLQVTRTVYELIYGYNFKVTERGEIQISQGRVIQTYFITP